MGRIESIPTFEPRGCAYPLDKLREWTYRVHMTETAERIRSRLQLRRGLPPPQERRELRTATGLTQQELADAVGVTRAAISQWEKGVRTPRGALLDRYVDALNAMREAA